MGKIPFSFTLLGFYTEIRIGLFSVVMHTDLNIGNVDCVCGLLVTTCIELAREVFLVCWT